MAVGLANQKVLESGEDLLKAGLDEVHAVSLVLEITVIIFYFENRFWETSGMVSCMISLMEGSAIQRPEVRRNFEIRGPGGEPNRARVIPAKKRMRGGSWCQISLG